MTPSFSIRSYTIAHAMSTAIAVFIAVLIDHYFTFGGCYWMILTAYLITQTTMGTPMRQGMHIVLVILATLICASLLLNANAEKTKDALLAAIFLGGCFWLLPFRGTLYRPALTFTLFLLIVIFVGFTSCTPQLPVSRYLIDMGLGALIGIISIFIFLPTHIEVEFRQGLLPTLKAYTHYAEVVALRLFHLSGGEAVENAKHQLENVLYGIDAAYPEWVYEAGFNRALRPGFRYFLIGLDRIAENLYTMDYLSSQPIEDPSRLNALAKQSKTCIDNNKALFNAMIANLSKGKINEPSIDLADDIAALEESLRTIVPSNLELLDINPDYMTLTAYVRNLKDLRERLLELTLSSIREANQVKA